MRVGVVGAGKSGLAAARFLSRLGARVLLSDRRTVKASLPSLVHVESGRHTDRLLACDLLIRSPGVPERLPILQKARRRGIPIWSELELASRFIRPNELVAITGTNGKTTTTTLVGELFKAAGKPTVVAGNIGTPLCDAVSRIHRSTVVVSEVSSYQLENIQTFHPTLSCILNITPDHLDHHGTMRAYIAAKARIFENQTARDVCVLNADDPACRRLARRCRARILFFGRRAPLREGVYYQRGRIVVRWKKRRASWIPHLRIPGPHNIENALAAVALALAGKVPLKTIQKGLDCFPGVEHRLETVRTWRGIRFINDSKSTNVDSTRVALQSFSEPLILIMGGRGKGSPYAPLRPLVKAHVRQLLLIGEEAGRIQKELGKIVPSERAGNLKRAVRRARAMARPGDGVLLSPACASFDQYEDYEHRGRHFKQLVRALG